MCTIFHVTDFFCVECAIKTGIRWIQYILMYSLTFTVVFLIHTQIKDGRVLAFLAKLNPTQKWTEQLKRGLKTHREQVKQDENRPSDGGDVKGSEDVNYNVI